MNSISSIDVIFPVNGSAIPRDHGYSLYAAISRIVPSVHETKGVGIFPIRGQPAGNCTLLLTDHSALRLRLPADRLPALLPLSGKALELDGHRLRVGVPHVAALIPAPILASPLVLIKVAHIPSRPPRDTITPDIFMAAAKKKLTEMNIAAEPAFQRVRGGDHMDEPRRRVFRIKNGTHVGFAMVVQGLTAEESVKLQEVGLGGRRAMGCGLFLPVRSD